MAVSLDRLHGEHEELSKGIAALKETADLIDLVSAEPLLVELEEAHLFLYAHLLPHAGAEEEVLYRAYDQVASSPWASEALKHDHNEISALARELTAAAGSLSLEGPTTDQRKELRRILFGLYTLLKSHFAKEEQLLIPRLEAALSPEAAEQLLASLEEATEANRAKATW